VGRLVVAPHQAGGTAARWPAWFAPLAFVTAFGGAALIASLLTVINYLAQREPGAVSPAMSVASVVAQDGILIAAAVFFASCVGRPTPGDFGLRRLPWKSGVAWTLAGLAAFYGISSLYAAVISPSGQQDVVQTLGGDRSLGLLVATAIVVILIAPVAEEVFFRGFFYRALRNRLSALLATLVVSILFGSIHYSGRDTLDLLPMLVLLGVIFCVLYERTGSLYPSIALHQLNNTIALAATTRVDYAAPVAIALGLIAVSGTLIAARLRVR
jgi:membrane protease YdiL (CAAX protease family)